MNENQENNLNSVNTEVTNTNPVEQPTVATPEVVEPVQPMASEPVQPVPPVVETPVAPVEPVETPTPAEVVQTVTPVEPAVNPAPSAAVTPNKKKSNVIVVILLVIVLLGVCGYGVYTYTDLLKPKDKTNENKTTTTTTTTTAVVNKLAFTSVDEYVAAAKVNDDEKSLIVDTANVLTVLDFDMDNKCAATGDAVSFEIGGNKVEYTCKAEYDEAICDNYWSTTIKVNDKFIKEYQSCTECSYNKTFTNKNVYVDMFEEECVLSALHNHIKLYDQNGTAAGETDYSISFSTKEDFSDQIMIKPVVKDKKLYFLHCEETQGINGTCTLKYIDLDASNPTIVDSGISTSCTIDE